MARDNFVNPKWPIEQRIATWRECDHVGASSLTIYGVLYVPTGERSMPCDSGDFFRCVNLLRFVPEWKPRLSEVAKKYPEWRKLIAAWDEVTALFDEEWTLNTMRDGDCPRLNARLTELRGNAW